MRALFVLGIVVFYLNDLIFAAFPGFVEFLFVDYSTKFLVIAFAAGAVWQKKATFQDMGFTGMSVRAFGAWTVILCATGIFVDQILWRLVEPHLPAWRLFQYPAPTNVWLEQFDIFAGTILVAFSEEIVFRGAFFGLFTEKLRPWLVAAGSAVLFSGAHWSLGGAALVCTGIWGFLPMICLLRTRSIWPAVTAHYVTNVISFSRVIPPDVFGLFSTE